jgi:hypothetical protein
MRANNYLPGGGGFGSSGLSGLSAMVIPPFFFPVNIKSHR